MSQVGYRNEQAKSGTRAAGLKFYEKSHRYKMTREPNGTAFEWVGGVTGTLGKGIAKPFLIDWAAREVARFAADNLETLNNLDDTEAVYHLLEKAHNRTRDKAGVRGTDVHDLAEKLLHGEAVEVPDAIEGYVTGYARFLDKWQPTAVLTERPVGNRHWWYAGKPDAVLTLPTGERLLVDWKAGKRVYGEAALQLAAYRGCEFYVTEDDTEAPMPEVDGLAVVHVTPTGTDLYRVGDPDAAWKDWLHVLWVARASDRIKNQITDPSDPMEQSA